MDKIYAVLTGDIVKYNKVAQRADLRDILRSVLDLICEKYEAKYDIFRGDSFQIILSDPSLAALVALIIRSRLISNTPKWDAIISIGIGTMTYEGEKVSESDGPAFHLSGEGLIQLGKEDKLIIKAPFEQSLELVTKFADNIINHWSKFSGETAFYQLVEDETQIDLAKRLGKSQPTIQHRIATAKLVLIKDYIQYVKQVINQGVK